MDRHREWRIQERRHYLSPHPEGRSVDVQLRRTGEGSAMLWRGTLAAIGSNLLLGVIYVGSDATALPDGMAGLSDVMLRYRIAGAISRMELIAGSAIVLLCLVFLRAWSGWILGAYYLLTLPYGLRLATLVVEGLNSDGVAVPIALMATAYLAFLVSSLAWLLSRRRSRRRGAPAF